MLKKREGRGFVLILVLVLLALVTILVVVSSIMARLERRASWNTARVEQARQNALFALSVAVGQLQRAAGPDQRVTARADILSSGTSIAQPYWTGVWQTYNSTAAATGTGFQYLDGETGGVAGSAMSTSTNGYNIRQWSTISGTNTNVTGTNALATCPSMAWLISGGTNNALINPSTTSTPNWFSNSVVLAKNLNVASSGSANATGITSVIVPLVPIMGTRMGITVNTSGTAGKYGYWVSDEGIKARVNLIDPTYGVVPQKTGTNFTLNQLHFLTPQANPVQNGLLGSVDTTTDIRGSQYASDLKGRVTSLQSLSLVGQQASPAVPLAGMSGTGGAFFSPDVTTWSRGVLADVCNGGLKVDLSQLFEDPTNQFNNFVTSFKLWQPVQPAWVSGDAKVWSIIEPSFDAGNDLTNAEFGPRWQSLYNYYAMYKNTVITSQQAAGSCPWSNINAYSQNNPGTNAPTVDERMFYYNSNPQGVSGSQTSETGEYYLPHILGLAVTFYMQAVPSTATSSTYNLIVYAVPEMILYNPYNVTLTASNSSPYTFSISTNMFGGGGTGGNGTSSGHTWSISIGGADSATVVKNKPICWNGIYTSGSTATTGTYGGNQLAFVTGTGAFPFQPGEIKAVGLSATTSVPCSQGSLLSFDGNGTDKVIGGPPVAGQYEYLYADTSSNGVMWTGTLTNPSSDYVTVTVPATGYGSNNGYYNLTGSPAYWPIARGSSPDTSLGRFFNSTPNISGSSTSVQIPISGMSSPTVQNLGAATQFCQFLLRVKGLTNTQYASQQLASGNPVVGTPIFASSDGAFNPIPVYLDDTIQDIYIGLNLGGGNSTTEIQTTGTDSYWGIQDAGLSRGDPSFLVLHDLPRQPMISLGQFMHMAMRNSAYNTDGIDTNSCLYPVGGSLADPFFATYLTNNNGTTPYNGLKPNPASIAPGSVAYFDDNFLMNQALFDTYYFSTLPPSASGSATDTSYANVMPSIYTSGSTQCSNANIQNGTVTLPNARMGFYWKNGIPPQTTTSGSPNYLMNYRTSSANLLMNGAFNVNSTSVQAWAALLSSLSGNPINYLIPSTTGTVPSWGGPLQSGSQAGYMQNPIFRIMSPVLSGSSEINSGGQSGGTASLWAGVNSLSNSQVLALATSIVNQVKQRGPFLSMADFLNRRLDPPCYNTGVGSPTGLGLKGALQAAIDNTASLTGTDLNNTCLMASGSAVGTSIAGSRNNAPNTASDLIVGSSTTVLQGESQCGPQNLTSTAEGSPGWLMQQDLVQCFSPVMTVRSDTFVVRCYGEADNQATGATEGRAWCEAVVQRLPDFVDQTDSALSSANAYTITGTPASLGDATPLYDRWSGTNASNPNPPAIVNTTNLTFGRRFKIISLRWLNESDL